MISLNALGIEDHRERVFFREKPFIILVGVESIRFNRGEIWTPDILISNLLN